MAFRNTKYTKERLENAVKESLNTAEVLRRLSLSVSGGNHRHISSRIKHYEIDTSHFKTGIKRDKKPRPCNLKAEEILINGVKRRASYLRRALIEMGIEEKCSECSLGKAWNGKNLQLQIDHKDGNNCNNSKDNLRFICPNCHTQTANYGARNISTYRLK